MTYILWIVQILLAIEYLFSGVMKFMMSVEDMNMGAKFPLPGFFIHFIGVCEIVGAIGLILPWLTGIKPVLTPLAAACFVIIMIGATIITLANGLGALAFIPAVTGLLAAFVAWGRFRMLPKMP